MALGGREFTEKRAEAARTRFAGARDVGRFVAGIVLIVLGALLLAEGIAGSITNSTLFFEGVNRGFEFIVGLVTLIVGASMIPEMKRQGAA